MLILGLLAISFLPLLIQGMRVTAQNRVLATATQIVNEELEIARSHGTCDELTDFSTNGHPNSDYDVTRTVQHPDDPLADPCSISYPGVLRVTIEVDDANTDARLVEATTLVLVRTEN